jgi:DHA1 family bicyclomycin/chloramphenicol resistance-like MFS transporter
LSTSSVRRWLPALLGLCTAMGPLATDMYLPAFPAIEAEFQAPAGAVQQTLAAWFIGLAAGQMLIGALSDRFGRRGPMLAGLILCTLASAGCALAPSLFGLSAFRLLAALGGGASAVIPRAVVRDVATGHRAAGMMAQLMLIGGVAPLLAPTLGAVLLGLFDWRFLFWVCAGHAATATLAVWLWLPDTLPAAHRQHSAPSEILRRFGRVLADPGFIAYAGMGGLGMFTIFAFISASPVIIPLYQVSPVRFGTLFMATASCFIVSSQANVFLIRRFGSETVLLFAALTMLASAMLLLVDALAGRPPLALLIGSIMAVALSTGLIAPNASISALSRHAGQAASASAVLGTIQFLMAAAAGMLGGWIADGTARPMALEIALGAAASLATFFVARRLGDAIPVES